MKQVRSTVGVHVVDSLLNGRDFLGLFIRNFGLEFLFQGHDQFPLQGSQKVYLLAAAPPEMLVLLTGRMELAGCFC